MRVEVEGAVPGSDPPIVVRVRSSGAINISTDVQHDRDNLEVRTPEDWAALLTLVAALQRAQASALSVGELR